MAAEVWWKMRHRATDDTNRCLDDTTIDYISIRPCPIYASNRNSASYLETTYARPAAGGSFQLRSDPFDSGTRKYKPIELATMALYSVSRCNALGSTVCSVCNMDLGALNTYIRPVRNTAVTAIFFLNDMCSVYKIGSGKTKM